MNDDLFDFGFSVVSEDELEVVQNATQSQEMATSCQERLDKLYSAIQPLLTNLKQNPEKEYILWPNRIEKIEQFEAHIKNIYEG